MPTPVAGEIIGYARLAWSIIAGAWKFARRHHRALSPQQTLELRTKWKPLFEEYLREHQRKRLRRDIIIRDMKRMDQYPDATTPPGRRISPWFRVGLIDTYEKGFMAGLGWQELLTDAETGELRRPNRDRGEKGTVNLMLTGYIPYENVESVDWDGDKYYGFPHIYCYFDFKGQPYERLGFCEKHDLNDHEYFTEVADYDAVRKLSRKHGVKR